MFCIPRDIFFNDFWQVLPRHLAEQAFEIFGFLNFFWEIHEVLGFTIKTKKDLDLRPTACGPILGHMAGISSRPFRAMNKPSRRAKIENLVLAHKRKNRVPPTEAGTLAGKSAHFATALYGRCGRAALKALYRRQHGSSHVLTVPLRAALRWIVKVMLSSPPREIFASLELPVRIG